MPIWVYWIRNEPLLPPTQPYPRDHAKGDRFLPKGHSAASKATERRKAKSFTEAIVDLEIKIFLDGYYKAWSMGSGPCRLCKECDLTSCKNGLKARPSMEACGIDVFKTARDNGFLIEVIKGHGEERNVYGLILVE